MQLTCQIKQLPNSDKWGIYLYSEEDKIIGVLIGKGYKSPHSARGSIRGLLARKIRVVTIE